MSIMRFMALILLHCATLTGEPRIAIVGGGLAGLTAAYRLMQAGLDPIVYEGSDRFGGRTYSGTLSENQVIEHGATFVDSDHDEIMELAAELGVELEDLLAGQTPGTIDIYQVIDYDACQPKKVRYTVEEAANDYFNLIDPGPGLSIYQQMVFLANSTWPTNDPQPGDATPWPLTYGDPATATMIDSMNLDSFINMITAFLRPDHNGSKSKLAQFLKSAYVEEFGAEPQQQSPFNMIYLLGFQELPNDIQPPNVPSSFFQPYGISDQRYHIRGGSERLALKLLGVLQENGITVYKNHRLTKMSFHGGPYALTFATKDGEITPPDFDRVVLAIPFSVMRQEFCSDGTPRYNGYFVDYTQANFSELKKYAIEHLAISRTSQMNVQFKNRFWREEGYDGNTYVTSSPYVNGKEHLEKSYQNSWESTRCQPGQYGILTLFTGGNKSEEYHTSSCPKRLKGLINQFLHQLSYLYPGATKDRNFALKCHRVSCTNWMESPWQRGAYAYWSPGQYIAGPNAFAGFEGVREPYDPETGLQNGTCHFAGEHTSYDYQGYMNGAVESGNRVANEILSDL